MSVAQVRHKIANWKIREVNYLSNLIRENSVVSITKMENLPSKQIQMIRNKLRGLATIRMARKNLIKRALESVDKDKPGVSKLTEHMEGAVALVLSNANPFKLARILEKNKIPAPAKPGQIAPKDIIVPAKDTGIAPGPIISELHEVGIPTKIEGGTVHVEKDTVVAKKGEVISEDLANVLKRLGIEPMEVGLSLLAAYDNGIIIEEELLHKPLEDYENMLIESIQAALSLSIEAGIIVPENAKIILQKAYMNALSVAVEASILTEDTAEFVLSNAFAKAITLAKMISEKYPEYKPKELEGLEVAIKPEKEEKKEEEKEPEEKSEEEAVGGLADLFG